MKTTYPQDVSVVTFYFLKQILREIIYIIPLIYHLFRYQYNYGQCNCQLESIENRVLKIFNLDPTESCL